MPLGKAMRAGDCDDANDQISPFANESANGIDDDCDGEIDEGLDDLDQDGFTTIDGDCDDSNGWVNPEIAEQCADGVDNNCNGEIDEGCEGVDNIIPPAARGCGCDVTGTSAPLLPVFLGMIALAVRRREVTL